MWEGRMWWCQRGWMLWGCLSSGCGVQRVLAWELMEVFKLKCPGVFRVVGYSSDCCRPEPEATRDGGKVSAGL